jgi:hypothetical protein
MPQTLASNEKNDSNGKEITIDNPSKGIFRMKEEIDRINYSCFC